MLPEGWNLVGEAQSIGLGREYLLELPRENPQEHELAGVPVIVIAVRDSNDDVLVQHLNEPDRFSVVHLTWLGRQEQPGFPTVEFTGSFTDFIAWEQAFQIQT